MGYVDGMENIVLGAFEKYPDADIITFQIVTPEGNPFNSGYPRSPSGTTGVQYCAVHLSRLHFAVMSCSKPVYHWTPILVWVANIVYTTRLFS